MREREKEKGASHKKATLLYCREAMRGASPIRQTTPQPLPVASGDLKKRFSVGGADGEMLRVLEIN